MHWEIEDPASGPPEQQLREFRRARDELSDRIRRWVVDQPESGGIGPNDFMPLVRDEAGVWSVVEEGDETAEWNPAFREALPQYLTDLDAAFTRARATCEFEFLLSLLRVRSLQDAGWDPYETTLSAIPALLKAHDEIGDFAAARHLQLWVYGRIVEASEPPEILANLVEVASVDVSKLCVSRHGGVGGRAERSHNHLARKSIN